MVKPSRARAGNVVGFTILVDSRTTGEEKRKENGEKKTALIAKRTLVPSVELLSANEKLFGSQLIIVVHPSSTPTRLITKLTISVAAPATFSVSDARLIAVHRVCTFHASNETSLILSQSRVHSISFLFAVIQLHLRSRENEKEREKYNFEN